MASHDWLPRGEQDLVDLCARWSLDLANGGKVASFNWDAAVCNKTLQLITAFTTARKEYEEDESRHRRIVKDKAKGAAVEAMREFANTSVRFNKQMPDEDKIHLGIQPRDTVITNHGAPAERPDTEIGTTQNRLEHKLRALFQGAAVKPPDATGVCFAWQIGGDPPTAGEHLPRSTFSHKTSFTLTFSEEDAGKTVWYSTCYENYKGEKGPWSLIESSTI